MDSLSKSNHASMLPYFIISAAFFKIESVGHEFHYSSVISRKKRYKYAFNIKRGYGINGKKDGLIYKNTIASFSHLRSCNSFDWIKYFIKHIEEVNGKANI